MLPPAAAPASRYAPSHRIPRDVEPTRSSMHIDAQLCPQHPSTLTPPRSSHHLRHPSTQASLSPSHPVERASIVKTVVDRIAGASLAIAATVAIATSPANAIQMGLPEEEVTKLICDAACETTINDAELVTTQSGLQYRDIKVGDGVQPEIGFQVGKFILILVWAIGLTSCFVYSRRLHREKRARTGAFIFISVRAIGLLTTCLFNQRTDLRQLPGKGKAERYSHHRTRTGRRHERHPRAGRGRPHDAIGRYQEALHPGRARVPQRSGIGAGKLIFSFILAIRLTSCFVHRGGRGSARSRQSCSTSSSFTSPDWSDRVSRGIMNMSMNVNYEY